MRKFLPKIKLCACLMICIAICIAVPCIAFADKKNKANATRDKVVLRIWQIDCFEGGKGSRADFLQNIGNDYSESVNGYVTVLSLSATAAVKNLSEGNIPDLISYGAGICGIENYIGSYVQWCYGSYCFLTLDTSADFSDINNKNTVVNAGKDNYAKAAALFSGLSGAVEEKPTGAYVSLINGKYKYLLGTQRDVFRLKTRGVSFAVKPIEEYNDLYQNISISAKGERAKIAQRFIDYLLTRRQELNRIGMLSEEGGLYDDEMRALEGVSYKYKLTTPISSNTKSEIEKYISDGNINKLKNLFK